MARPHAGIEGETLAANQTSGLSNAEPRLEQLPQEIGVAEPALARLGKGVG